MGPVVLDANVVISFLNPDDHLHRRATELLQEHEAAKKLMPASAYAEALVHAVAAGRDAHVDRFIRASGVEVVPFERTTAHVAAELRKRHRTLSPEDSWVLATAQEREATLITFDKRLARFA